MLSGLDVSKWQGNVDWDEAARAGATFAICKASEGKTYRDPTFEDNYRGARDAGLVPGAYHFTRFAEVIEKEADNFLRQLARVWARDASPVLIALDVEVPPATAGAFGRLRKWIEIVERATERPVLLYTYPSFWQEQGNPSGFERQPLWIAHYTRPAPRVPKGWNNWTFWQKSADAATGYPGRWPGVNTDVDVNVFNGDLKALQALAKGNWTPMQINSPARARETVREIQRALAQGGYSPGPTDGLPGPRTGAALRAVGFHPRMLEN